MRTALLETDEGDSTGGSVWCIDRGRMEKRKSTCCRHENRWWRREVHLHARYCKTLVYYYPLSVLDRSLVGGKSEGLDSPLCSKGSLALACLMSTVSTTGQGDRVAFDMNTIDDVDVGLAVVVVTW